MAWDRRGLTAGASLLLGWTLWTGLAGAFDPQLVHRDRDGTAPLFRQLSGAREWTGLLPAYVLADPDRHRLGAVWAVAILAALPWRARAVTARRVAAAGLGLVLAAQAAAAVTHARTDDRDAVRLVGRPAVRVPGWSAESQVSAEWTPEALGWGPVYEPHRAPDGAEVGRRLPLPPGRYRLALLGEALSPDGAVPSAGGRAGPRRGAGAGLPGPAGPLGLGGRLRGAAGGAGGQLAAPGGGPILLKGLRLSVQPAGAGPV